MNLINSKGGIDGYKIRINEIDNNYKVPPAIEGYERQKQQGAVSHMIWGTPQAQALNPRLEQDQIPGTSPGFGSAAAANGAKYPVPVPGRRDLLVAGRRRGPVRQGQAGRQPEGQEDRLSLLRQPGRHRAAADPQGSAEERGLRAAHLRRAAARRGDERAGARHLAALPARFRASRTCSAARRRWRSRN